MKTESNFASIFSNLKEALAAGERRDQEITSQIEALAAEQTRIRTENARARSGLEAMAGKDITSPKSATPRKKPGPKPGRKPGPKPGPKPTKAPVAKVAAKPAKAAKATKAAAKPAKVAKTKKAAVAKPASKPVAKKGRAKKEAPKANVSNAAEGRRAVARGDRPPMKEAMATVMGKATMEAPAVVEGLKKRGWTPNARDPQQYVSYMLSSNKDVFERVERGHYKVREGVVFGKKKAKNGTGDTAPKKAAAATPGTKTTDEHLGDLGIGKGNVSANPFATT